MFQARLTRQPSFTFSTERMGKTYNDVYPFSETVEATSKEDAEEQVRQKLRQQYDMEKSDSPQVIERSVDKIDFVTREPPK